MKTKDYGLTCLLLCKGTEILNYEEDATGQTWFEFPETDTVTAVTSDFYMNRASVLVHDFLSAQKRVKNIINHRRDYGYEYDNRNFSRER